MRGNGVVEGVTKAGPALPGPEITRPGKAERRWLDGLAGGARLQTVAGTLAGTAAGLLQIAQAWIVAVAVAALAAGASPPPLAFAALAGVVVARAACAWVWEVAGTSAASRVKAELRCRLFRHLAALGPVHAGTRGSGALAAGLIEQCDALDGYVARYRPQTMVAGLVPLAILAAVFPVDWVAGTVLLAAGPMVPVLMAVVGMGAASQSQSQFRSLARMSGHLLDRLQGLVTLKLFGRAEAEAVAVAGVADEFRRRTMSVLRLAFLSSAVLEFFTAVAVAVVAIYVGFSLLGWVAFGPASAMTLEKGLFVLMLAPEFFQPLRQLSAYYHDRASALGAARELKALLDDEPPARPARGRALPPGPPAVRFDGVHLTFPGRSAALSGVTFTIAAGERVALVGPSGSGKTTILNVLLGFAVPDRGRATIGGIPVGELDEPTLRHSVTWVGQTPRLLPGTLRDNIRLSRPDAGDVDVERAAGLAHVMDFARSLPAGLDTTVGERGFGLSGGQAQRVALARAFLRDAPLLLLDEPTANLDAENERLVLDALARLAVGRTVLIATHSPAGMNWAERRIRIGRGRVFEEAA